MPRRPVAGRNRSPARRSASLASVWLYPDTDRITTITAQMQQTQMTAAAGRTEFSYIGRIIDYFFGRNSLIGLASLMLLAISGYATWSGMNDFIIGVQKLHKFTLKTVSTIL